MEETWALVWWGGATWASRESPGQVRRGGGPFGWGGQVLAGRATCAAAVGPGAAGPGPQAGSAPRR